MEFLILVWLIIINYQGTLQKLFGGFCPKMVGGWGVVQKYYFKSCYIYFQPFLAHFGQLFVQEHHLLHLWVKFFRGQSGGLSVKGGRRARQFFYLGFYFVTFHRIFEDIHFRALLGHIIEVK